MLNKFKSGLNFDVSTPLYIILYFLGEYPISECALYPTYELNITILGNFENIPNTFINKSQ